MEIANEFIQKFIETEDKLLKQVAKNLLKREPTIEDYRDFQVLRMEGVEDEYDLAYKNMKLGTVKRNFHPDENGKAGVVFTPFEMKDFLEPVLTPEGKYNKPTS